MSLTAMYYVRAATIDALARLTNTAIAAGDEPQGGPIFGAGEFVQAFITGTLDSIGAAASVELTDITAATLTTSGATSASSLASTGNTTVGATLNVVGSIEMGADDYTLSQLKWVDVDVPAATLDGAGSVQVQGDEAGFQFYVRALRLNGGGTNFGAGGNRTIVLTDGTTVWTTVPNASMETAPATSVDWGNAAVPFNAGTAATPSASLEAIRFQYAGGTTDHGGVGTLKFSVLVERVAGGE